MKDYSLYSDNRKEWVKNYKIKDNNIIVNYAKGKKKVIPYTEEEEKLLSEKMESQTICLDYRKKRIKERRKDNATFIIPLAAFGALLTSLGLNIDALSDEVLYWAFTSIYCITPVVDLIKVIKDTKIIKDINKTQYFLDNENIINNNLNKEKDLKKVSIPTKHTIKKDPENKFIFNPNTINNIPYGDLKRITKNIENKPKTKILQNRYNDTKNM